MSIDPLRLTMPFDKALAKIDTMKRFAAEKKLWIIVSDRCPVAGADKAEADEHADEITALLHYARVGLCVSHDKL